MILECIRSEIDARSRVPQPPSALLKVFRTAERKNRRALHVNRGDVASNAPVAVKKHALPPRERHERAGPAWVFEPIQTRGDGARKWSDTIQHFCIGSNILIDHYAQQYARERRGWMSRLAPSRVQCSTTTFTSLLSIRYCATLPTSAFSHQFRE